MDTCVCFLSFFSFRLPPMFFVLLTGHTREHSAPRRYYVYIQKRKHRYIGLTLNPYAFLMMLLLTFLPRLPPMFILLLTGHTREHVILADLLYTYRDVNIYI